MKRLVSVLLVCVAMVSAQEAPDNNLTADEKEAGWLLLFNGKDLSGWKADTGAPSKTPVQDGAINPHGSGAYMLVYDKYYGDFILSLDFKISAGCNSGVFVRTFPLKSVQGHDVGWNGLEVAIDDTTANGYTDTGAIYDLVAPTKNAMKPAGEWNHLVITCNRNLITVDLNNETVTNMNLDDFKEPKRRPDGSEHGFEKAWYTHSRKGHIGLQDHGSDCWFKNIKLLPMNDDARARPESKAIIK